MDDSQLDATFAALADATRRAILAKLAHGEATVNELAEPFEISKQAVSKHIQVLELAGLTAPRLVGWAAASTDLDATLAPELDVEIARITIASPSFRVPERSAMPDRSTSVPGCARRS